MDGVLPLARHNLKLTWQVMECYLTAVLGALRQATGAIDLNWSDFLDAAWQFALVTGISFVVLTLLSSLVRFHQLQHPTLLMPAAEISDATRFAAQVAARLGSAYRLPQPFCVLMIASPALAETTRGEQLLTALKHVIRRTDSAMFLEEGLAGVLVEGQRRHADNLITRLQAEAKDLGGIRCGLASCPENGTRTQVLLDAARAALPSVSGGTGFAEPAAPSTELAAPDPITHDNWIDPLTGVLKADRVGRVLRKFVARYRREGSPVSMICLDVDYLSRYVDHYSPAAGEEILRGIGALLQRSLREDDLIGCTEDNGFIVLLSCAPTLALNVAHRMANEIKRATFTSGGFTLKVTISGGVAGYPDHGRTGDVIRDAANAALLVAKERGCNMCLMFDASMRTHQHLNRGPDEF